MTKNETFKLNSSFYLIFLKSYFHFFVLFRFESYYNYCSLFNCILTSGSPVTLDLPNQWLWEIIDEFIYQFQSFVQFRAKLGKKTSEELDILRQNPRTWDVLQVPNHFILNTSKTFQFCPISNSSFPPLPSKQHFFLQFTIAQSTSDDCESMKHILKENINIL